MPIEVENKLKARAQKKGLKGKHAKAYVYGTMNKLGLLESIHPRLVELAKKIDLGDHFEGPTCAPLDSNPRVNYPTLYVSGKKESVELPDKGTATIQYRIRNRSMTKYGEDEAKHSVDIEVQSIEPHEEKDKSPREGDPAKLLEDVRKLRLLARGDIFKKALPGYLEHSSIRGGSVAAQQAEALQQIRRIRQRAKAVGGLVVDTLGGPRVMRVTKPKPIPRSLFSCVPAFLIEFADPRPRNSMGEYTSDPGEGVDPNQMAAAYGPPDVSESHMQRIKDFFLKRRQAEGA